MRRHILIMKRRMRVMEMVMGTTLVRMEGIGARNIIILSKLIHQKRRSRRNMAVMMMKTRMRMRRTRKKRRKVRRKMTKMIAQWMKKQHKE